MGTLPLQDAELVVHWRKRAEKLRSLARITTDPRSREELADLASQWDGMAAHAEMLLKRRLGAEPH